MARKAPGSSREPARLVDDDPVTAEYDVFITPELEEKLYLLQFPTRGRDLPYNDAASNKPLEMRMKPKTGFVEIDVPISTEFYYNRTKAKTWGQALTQAKAEGAHGHGLATGFGHVSGIRASGRRELRSSRDVESTGSPEDRGGESTSGEDSVPWMKVQTLGGQIMKEENGKPMYMVGVFRENELHLTKFAGIVQMRPQFHHIDAKTQVDRNKSRREREAAEPPRTVEARMVQMTVKAQDTQNPDRSSTKDLLQAAQDEPWLKLQYHDEEVDEAYVAYQEKLFLEETSAAPHLRSSMTNEDYLDAISAPRIDPNGRVRVKPMTKRKKATVDISDGDSEPEGALADQE